MKMKAGLFIAGVSGAIAVFVIVFIRSRPAHRQAPDQVVIRELGQRMLGDPQPALPEALKQVDFAWLAVSAYQRTPDAKIQEKASDCPSSGDVLEKRGWKKWANTTGSSFPHDDLKAKFDKFHLRVEIWVNVSRNIVAVAFGGTVLNNRNDWRSNLRWFIPVHRDEYTATVELFAPAFRDEFLKQSAQSNLLLTNASIISTGHSLGGGLAQEFAYALPVSQMPRVSQVYAFDPTPVSGFSSVERSTRETNVKGLKIDRIYERREALAILRSVTNVFWKPSSLDPAIRQIRYNLFPTHNPISGHSMNQLACKLEETVSRVAR